MAVAVEVDRVLVEARRHELRHAQGAGIAAAPGERVDPFAVAQHEPVLQLVAEELAAVLAPGRKVEGKGGERVDDPEVAHLPPVDGLDADDPDDDLRRHAVDLLGLRQPLLVGAPEGDAGADADRLDEAGAVGGPVLRRAGRRRHDEARHARHEAGLLQGGADPGGIEAAALGQGIGEAHHVVARAVGHEVGRAVVGDARLQRAPLRGVRRSAGARCTKRARAGRQRGDHELAAKTGRGHGEVLVSGRGAAGCAPRDEGARQARVGALRARVRSAAPRARRAGGRAARRRTQRVAHAQRRACAAARAPPPECRATAGRAEAPRAAAPRGRRDGGRARPRRRRRAPAR